MPPPSHESPLDLTVTATVGSEHASFIQQHLLAAAALLDVRPDALTIVIVDDDTMSRLHGQFLDLHEPTDVLTFELDHDADGRVTEGEVYVCLPVAERQAATLAHGVREELLLYALHGLLHLSGYDDHAAADYERMHAREDELLEAIGIGRLFGER